MSETTSVFALVQAHLAARDTADSELAELDAAVWRFAMFVENRFRGSAEAENISANVVWSKFLGLKRRGMLSPPPACSFPWWENSALLSHPAWLKAILTADIYGGRRLAMQTSMLDLELGSYEPHTCDPASRGRGYLCHKCGRPRSSWDNWSHTSRNRPPPLESNTEWVECTCSMSVMLRDVKTLCEPWSGWCNVTHCTHCGGDLDADRRLSVIWRMQPTMSAMDQLREVLAVDGVCDIVLRYMDDVVPLPHLSGLVKAFDVSRSDRFVIASDWMLHVFGHTIRGVQCLTRTVVNRCDAIEHIENTDTWRIDNTDGTSYIWSLPDNSVKSNVEVRGQPGRQRFSREWETSTYPNRWTNGNWEVCLKEDCGPPHFDPSVPAYIEITGCVTGTIRYQLTFCKSDVVTWAIARTPFTPADDAKTFPTTLALAVFAFVRKGGTLSVFKPVFGTSSSSLVCGFECNLPKDQRDEYTLCLKAGAAVVQSGSTATLVRFV